MKETFLGAFDVRDYRRYKIPRAGNVLLWKETSRTERNGIGENKERKKERKKEAKKEKKKENKEIEVELVEMEIEMEGMVVLVMVVLVGVEGRGREREGGEERWKIRLPNGRADSQKGDEIKKSEILREKCFEKLMHYFALAPMLKFHVVQHLDKTREEFEDSDFLKERETLSARGRVDLRVNGDWHEEEKRASKRVKVPKNGERMQLFIEYRSSERKKLVVVSVSLNRFTSDNSFGKHVLSTVLTLTMRYPSTVRDIQVCISILEKDELGPCNSRLVSDISKAFLCFHENVVDKARI
ncbi:hypothetical protein V1478_001863 [Vespula squamosa]|uniref:Uncharacterized protein n=1 Tax=Vespula squamosa TaxID=30214 RepID=A0ABD2BYB8_VESSQ